MVGGTPIAGTALNSSNTYYSPLFGGGTIAEPPLRSTGFCPYDFCASAYTNYIIASSAGATFTLQKNDSATHLSVSSTAGQTGYLMDNSDTVAFAAGDTCANQVVVGPEQGSGDTSITWSGASLLLTAD